MVAARGHRRGEHPVIDVVVDVFSAIAEAIWGVIKFIGHIVWEVVT